MTRPTSAIVVGIDLSDTGDLALAEALRFARHHFGSALHVAHVLTEEEVENARGATRLERLEGLLAALPEALWARIRRVDSENPAPHSDVAVSVHVRIGPPAAGLLQVAADYDADFLVVGSHGRNRLERFLLGSVASELVQAARCPVLVVRPKNYAGITQSPRVEPAGGGRDAASFREPHLYTATRSLSFVRHNSNTQGPTGVRMI